MDECRFIALRLASEGYGTVREILDTPVDLVLDMLHYSNFRSDFDSTFRILNAPTK